MMDDNIKTIFKQAILEKHTKVYSDITSYYFEKIQEMKPKLFLSWLSVELEIPQASLNYGSFIMAMYRHKKRKKKEKLDKPTDIGNSIKKDNPTKILDFTMPDPTTREFIDQNKIKKANTLKPQ